MAIDPKYPCKTCGHIYEDHMIGLGCGFCWSEAGFKRVNAYSDTINPDICKLFEGDNLKYMEMKSHGK
jgi:hypothetical protein